MYSSFEFSNPLKNQFINALETYLDLAEQNGVPPEQILASLWLHISNSVLSYTAHPNSHATERCIALAITAFHQQDLKNPAPSTRIRSSIELLMPSLCDLEHICDPDKNFFAHWDDKQKQWLDGADSEGIQAILADHILGREGKCLIPIFDILQQNADDAFYPYFVSDAERSKKDNILLKTDEHRRAYLHSPLTRQLFEARMAFAACQTEGNHLLGQLTLMLQAFRQSSILHLGHENEAEQGIYPAIKHFFDFYQALPDCMRQKIPISIQNWVTEFLTVLSGKSSDIMALCLNQQAKKLAICLEENSNLLLDIGLTSAEQIVALQRAEASVSEAQINALQSYQHRHVRGTDDLPITPVMMAFFATRLNNTESIIQNGLERLDKASVQALVSVPALLKSLLAHFAQADNLITFAHKTSEATLGAVLEILSQNHIKADDSLMKAKTLIWCKNTMSPEQSAQLTAYIINSNAKTRQQTVLNFLNYDDVKNWFVRRVLGRLCGIKNGATAIANAKDFIDVLRRLPSDLYKDAIEAAKPCFAHWFCKTNDVRLLFASLTQQAHEADVKSILECMLAYIPNAKEKTSNVCDWMFFLSENPLSCKPSQALFLVCKPQMQTLLESAGVTQHIDEVLLKPFEDAYTIFKAAWIKTHPRDSLFYCKSVSSHHQMQYDENPRKGL